MYGMVLCFNINRFFGTTEFHSKIVPNSAYIIPASLLLAFDFSTVGFVWFLLQKACKSYLIPKYAVGFTVFSYFAFSIFMSVYEMVDTFEIFSLVNRYAISAYIYRIPSYYSWDNEITG